MFMSDYLSDNSFAFLDYSLRFFNFSSEWNIEFLVSKIEEQKAYTLETCLYWYFDGFRPSKNCLIVVLLWELIQDIRFSFWVIVYNF